MPSRHRLVIPDNSHVDEKDDGLSETKGVNAVRVVAFRRRTSDATQDFEYDPKNNILLENLVEKDVGKDDYYEGLPHKHLVATGNVSISQGYDYRIVAIAYNKDENKTLSLLRWQPDGGHKYAQSL